MGSNVPKKKGTGDAIGGGDSQHTTEGEQPQGELFIQAVLLIDDWEDTNDDNVFQPMLYDIPKVLLPVCNIPMIEYVLHFIQEQCCIVHELYIVCSTKTMEQYLLSSKYCTTTATTMKVFVIYDNSISNAGDALREIDRRNVITTDPFLLLFGNILTNCCYYNYNIWLPTIIQQHLARRKKDSTAIMTCNFITTTNQSSNLIVGIDPVQENRILLYDDNAAKPNISLPCSFYNNSITNQITLRTDLLDIGMDICSPDVLARFSDEFDYRHIRREFVTNSCAEEEEGLQNKIYAHVLNDTASTTYYAGRITCWKSYSQVSNDLLNRYVYPIVPDHNNHYNTATSSKTKYTIQPHYVYMECNIDHQHHHPNDDNTKRKSNNTIIGRTSVVRGPCIMIGINGSIGENCQIIQKNVVIGRNCSIGNNVTIGTNCYIMDDVTIENNVTLHNNIIIGSYVMIKSNAIISNGCMIGSNCIVGTNITLPEYTRLTAHPRSNNDSNSDFDDDSNDDDDAFSDVDDDEQDDKVEVNDDLPDRRTTVADTNDVAVVGEDGKGRVWLPSLLDDDDSDSDEDDDNNDVKEQRIVEWLRTNSMVPLDQTDLITNQGGVNDDDDCFSDDDYNQSLDGGDDNFDVDNNDGMQDNFNDDNNEEEEDDMLFTGDGTGATSSEPIGRQKGVDVVKELKSICLEFDATTAPIDNLIIELNSFKFSQNATYANCTKAATLAILEKMNIPSIPSDGKLVADWKASLSMWLPLFTKMAIGLDEEKAIVEALDMCATNSDNTEGYDVISHALTGKKNGAMPFRFLLQTLHDEEIVSEEAILAWAADSEQYDATTTARGKLLRSQPVQDFLQWLEQDSSSEDEEDDNEDDDE